VNAPDALARVRIVLLGPREPGNVGAVARALKNMGLMRLVIADAPALDRGDARHMAVHAADVLDRAETRPTLAEAVAGCGLIVGTSGRASVMRTHASAPRDAAAAIVAAARANDVAVVFGPEDHGLSTDELARCHRVLAIPASDAYPSLNLAQAVLLVSYELRLAALAPGVGAPRVLAPSERMELLIAKLETALRAIDFLHGDGAPHVLRQLRRILGRAELDDAEVDVLLGVARQIAWAARFVPGAPDARAGAGPDAPPAPGAPHRRASERR
jgi:tRNA/rRNA methyltransferase/tRNA (cytidine32/uridine32-2'-O)-methyltransferase